MAKEIKYNTCYNCGEELSIYEFQRGKICLCSYCEEIRKIWARATK